MTRVELPGKRHAQWGSGWDSQKNGGRLWNALPTVLSSRRPRGDPRTSPTYPDRSRSVDKRGERVRDPRKAYLRDLGLP